MIVYKVTNLISGKIYIGKTKHDLETRKYFHLKNKRKSKFHKAIQKYGIENFKWEVIYDGFSIDNINNKEKYFIELYDSINNGYNLTKGGDGGDVRSGMKNSEEWKKIMKEKLTDVPRKEETKSKISVTLKQRYENSELSYKPFNVETQKIIKYKYLIEKKSIRQISKELNIVNKRIERYFRNNDIEIRSKSESGKKIISEDTIKLIIKLYVEDCKTINHISICVNLSCPYITKLLKNNNIKISKYK